MSAFTGTARLTRLALRRDRLQLPLWILGTVLLLATTISATREQYPTEEDRLHALTTVAGSPAVLILRSAPTNTSEGGMLVFQILTFLALLAGFMSTLAVVRHTRQNEETGRSEMLGSMVVGRYASLTAALVTAAIANAVLAALVALTLAGSGMGGAGAAAAGVAVGVAGLSFAGLAAVAAQVAQGARAANGMAAAAIGIAFLVRGFGDAFGEIQPNGYTVDNAWPVWLSPIGWAEQVRPYAGESWWVLALPLALFAGSVAVAFAVASRRDVGMGLIAARPGPRSASRALLGPFGLAWRLQRGTLLGWAVGVGAMAAVVGSLSGTVEEAFRDNANAAETIAQLGGGDTSNLVNAFFAAMMAIIGAMVAGYVVQALMRPRAEEAGGPAEAVLATATGRLRWLAAHVTVAVGGAAGLLLLAGVSTGLVYGLTDGDLGRHLADMTGAALVQLPAALILAGVAIAAYGLLPRLAAGLAWAAFTVSLVLGQLGDLLGLPQAVRDISPFSHVPPVPAVDATAGPLLALVAVALALGVAGMASFRQRNLAL
jgi:ABC-2 type transport system permease protein